MVLLTMTPTIVAALNEQTSSTTSLSTAAADEPSLSDPIPGNPISHHQLLALSSLLKANPSNPHDSPPTSTLNTLLHGTRPYIPPAKPKPAQTAEYKALMARLRRDEEARVYAHMTSSSSHTSHASHTKNPFTIPGPKNVHQTPLHREDEDAEDEDSITHADIHRQITLIINVLVTIVACGIGIWIVARRWAEPARLALSMLGAGVVGVAEVVIYAGYLRRLREAREVERKRVERRVVVGRWVAEPRRGESVEVGSEDGHEAAGTMEMSRVPEAKGDRDIGGGRARMRRGKAG